MSLIQHVQPDSQSGCGVVRKGNQLKTRATFDENIIDTILLRGRLEQYLFRDFFALHLDGTVVGSDLQICVQQEGKKIVEDGMLAYRFVVDALKSDALAYVKQEKGETGQIPWKPLALAKYITIVPVLIGMLRTGRSGLLRTDRSGLRLQGQWEIVHTLDRVPHLCLKINAALVACLNALRSIGGVSGWHGTIQPHTIVTTFRNVATDWEVPHWESQEVPMAEVFNSLVKMLRNVLASAPPVLEFESVPEIGCEPEPKSGSESEPSAEPESEAGSEPDQPRKRIPLPSLKYQHQHRYATAQTRYLEYKNYIKGLIVQHGCLHIVNVDFGYRHQYDELKNGDVAVSLMPDAKAQGDFKKFQNSERRNTKLFGAMVGYLWRHNVNAYGAQEFHCVFFYKALPDGVSIEQLVDQIGQYWDYTVTDGRGMHHACEQSGQIHKVLGFTQITKQDAADSTQRWQVLVRQVCYMVMKDCYFGVANLPKSAHVTGRTKRNAII